MPRKYRKIASDARRAMNAVVRLHVRGFAEMNLNSILDPRFAIPEEWTGSGFFIRVGNQEGYILTNSHVARNASSIEIHSLLTSDEPFKAELVGLIENLEPDIAVLRLSPSEIKRFKKFSRTRKIPYLKFADPRNIVRGEEIKAIGYPLGMEEPNMSGGEISNFIAGAHDVVERIVTDAAINPGNSGGPAIIKGGRVIGINTAIAMGASNIGFITPFQILRNLLPQLLRKQRVGICVLGAQTQRNSTANAKYLKQKKLEGLIITKVLPGGLAAQAKLRPKDILYKINGHRFDRHGNVSGESRERKTNIFDILPATPVGEPIKFHIYRDGKSQVITTLSRSLPVQEIHTQPIFRHRRYICFEGMVLQEICAEILNAMHGLYNIDPVIIYRDFKETSSRVIVTHINQGSQAEEIGIDVGDFITGMGKNAVFKINQIEKILNQNIRQKKPHVLMEFSSGSFGYFSLQNVNYEDSRIKFFGEKLGSENL